MGLLGGGWGSSQQGYVRRGKFGTAVGDGKNAKRQRGGIYMTEFYKHLGYRRRGSSRLPGATGKMDNRQGEAITETS